MSNKNSILGTQIGAARKLLKISQAELAASAGVGEATIKNVEAGSHEPRQSTLKVIRDALEQRGIEFINGDNPGVRLHRSKVSTKG